MATAQNQSQISPTQQNMLARQAVLSKGVEMVQSIFSQTINPAQVNPILVQPRNVGLIKSFLVVLSGTITNNDGANALAITDFGLANLLSNITFVDLNNNQRINTSGWHLSWLNSLKHRQPFASGYALETDTMGGYGETYGVLSAPSAIAAAGNGTFRAVFEVPISYSPDDLRGAIYANVVNATMQLSLTVNKSAFTATGTDSTFAVYKGTANAAISSLTVNVYQNYIDQLPIGQSGVVLPLMDLATVYELKNTNLGSISANNEFPYQYSNFRDFLSTFMVYNHDTSADAGRSAGSDINYWALQSANFTNIWKLDPLTLAMRTRQILNTDLPKGAYYASSRRKPISSVQYGNIELILNPITATANSQLYIGLEDFSYANTITGAGSLAG